MKFQQRHVESRLVLGSQQRIIIFAWLVENKGTPKSKKAKRGANSEECATEHPGFLETLESDSCSFATSPTSPARSEPSLVSQTWPPRTLATLQKVNSLMEIGQNSSHTCC